jgi:hypothetical protein
MLNLKVEAHHHPVSTKDPTVTVVRNPIESIASSIILDINGKNLNKFEYLANYEIAKYDFFTNYILKTNRMIIDFNDIDKINEIVECISKTFKIPYREEKLNLSMDGEKSHLLSSKSHNMYEEVLDFLNNSDLSACYEAYNKALLLKIKL